MESPQVDVPVNAKPHPAMKGPPKLTRTMDQVDKKFEAHSPKERRVLMAHLKANWDDAQG